MKNRFQLFILGFALAVQGPASAADAFRAVLRASGEASDSRPDEKRPVALVVVDGTYLTLFLPSDQADSMTEAHLRKGSATAGAIIVSLDSGSSARSSRIGERLAADIVAHPETYFVDARGRGLPGSPSGEFRGHLIPAPGLPIAAWLLAPQGTSATAPVPFTPGSSGVPVGGIPADGAPMHRAVGSHGVTPGPGFARAVPEASPVPPEEVPQMSGEKIDQTIRFREISVRYYRDGDFHLYASASSGLDVLFTASGDCSVNGSTVHLFSAGKCFVTAHQSGGGRFGAAPDVDQSFSIEKARQSISFWTVKPRAYLDPDFGLEASASSGLPVVFRAAGDCAVTGSLVHLKAAGTCFLTAHQPGDRNYTAAEIVDQQFAIAKGDQTIDFKQLPPPDWWGAAFPLQAVATSGLPVRFVARGSCITAGSGEILQYTGYGKCTVIAQQPGDESVNPAPDVEQVFTLDPSR